MILARRCLLLSGAVAVLGAATISCSNGAAPNSAPRTYRLGFSATPPRLTVESVIQTITAWEPHSDVALINQGVPWRALLADTSAAVLVRRDLNDLAAHYHGRGIPLIVEIDVTDGLARDREAPDLVALGRSISEPAVQQVYRDYIAAVDSILHPQYLGLAMEVNLIRAIAPASVYAAVVTMAAGGENTLVAQKSSAKRFVSVQVETAWGRLPNVGTFVGIEKERADFPYITALGLSSYPYLAGFANPNDVPVDYYARLNSSTAPALPMLVVEGGWSSGSVPGVTSSPQLQALWIKHQMELADRAALVAVTQISFTDLDLSSYPAPPGSILSLFGQLGLVDVNFNPKPALAEWDRALARPLRTN
ncbi:MAG TPA: hypothetical protein VGG76_08770 [Gemmatimonadaceae bacterium]